MTKTWAKEVRRKFAHKVPGDGRDFLSLVALLLPFVLGGCASDHADTASPQPGSGIVEYRELTKEALTAMHGTLELLNEVATQSNPSPPKLIAAFSDKVQRLQVDSLRIRARVQAIQARGDAYFADWSETISRIRDPQVRAAAERFHPQLQESFSKIKLASQQAGGAFKPFLHGMRMLRLQLGKQGGLSQDSATQELVRTSRAEGDEVVHQLTLIYGELDAITKMLKSGKPVANN